MSLSADQSGLPSNEPPPISNFEAPLNWVGTRESQVLLAQQVFFQLTEGQVIFTFGMPDYPLELPTTEVRERMVAEGVDVRVVAQVALYVERLPSIIQALQGVYDQRQGGTATQPNQSSTSESPS